MLIEGTCCVMGGLGYDQVIQNFVPMVGWLIRVQDAIPGSSTPIFWTCTVSSFLAPVGRLEGSPERASYPGVRNEWLSNCQLKELVGSLYSVS